MDRSPGGHLRADARPPRTARSAGVSRDRVRARRADTRQRHRDAAARDDREPRDDRRRARHRPHRHHRGQAGRQRSTARSTKRRPPSILHAAHRELRALLLPSDLVAIAHARGRDLRRSHSGAVTGSRKRATALDAFTRSVQPHLTGTIRLRLFKGDCRVAGRAARAALDSRHSSDRCSDGIDRRANTWHISGQDGSRAIPTPRSSSSADRSASIAGCSKTTCGEPGVGGGARARRRADARPMPRRFDRRPARRARRAAPTPSFFDSAGRADGRGRPRVRRARAGRAHRRRRPAAAHRPVAQRAGRRRSAPVSQAPHPGAAAGDRRADRRARRAPRPRRRRADAVVHASAPRAADPRRAFLPRARRRAAARSRAARRRCCDDADELPLGSGAIAGTSYRDRRGTARPRSRLLAASSATASTPPAIAISSRRFSTSSSLTMVHLSRLAEDMILFTSEEFGFFELADTAATGSSLMPQKKNPDPLELVRGKAGRVDRPPRRLAGDDEGAADRLQQGSAGRQGSAVRGGGYAARLARGDGVGRRRHRRSTAATAERAASGLLLATDVADYLVAKGVPFRDAHEIVGALVRRLVARGALVRGSDATTNGARTRRCSTPTSDTRDHAGGVGGEEAHAAVDASRCRRERARRAAQLVERTQLSP